jgi:hypothetical protein
MHKVTLTILALALMFLATPITGANATTRDQAEDLCSKNPNCGKIFENDDGSIYCVRQGDGSCVVIVCGEILDCYVYRTRPHGGTITITGAVAEEMFNKKTKSRMTSAGVRRALMH